MHWQSFSPASSTDSTNRPRNFVADRFQRARCFLELTGTIPFGNEARILVAGAPFRSSPRYQYRGAFGAREIRPPRDRTSQMTPSASRGELVVNSTVWP